MDNITEFLDNCNSRVPFTGKARFNEPLSEHTTFKTGGQADLWIRPEGDCFPDYCAVLLESARTEGIPVFIMGGGANVVFPDEGYRGIVLDTSGYSGVAENQFLINLPRSTRRYTEEGKTLLQQPPCKDELKLAEWQGNYLLAGIRPPSIAESSAVKNPKMISLGIGELFFRAGTSMDEAVEYAAEQGLSGLEFLAGMPGTLGGALWMNARAYEREMADVVNQVQILDQDGIRTFIPPKTDFAYKKSPFQGKECLILSLSVTLEPGTIAQIREKGVSYRKDRESKGHFRFPSAGSVFKNNRAFGKPTGQIIDELGLKGLSVGDAQVAPWHGNFIINRGKARSGDILALVEMIEARVKNELGLTLEREIFFVKRGS